MEPNLRVRARSSMARRWLPYGSCGRDQIFQVRSERLVDALVADGVVAPERADVGRDERLDPVTQAAGDFAERYACADPGCRCGMAAAVGRDPRVVDGRERASTLGTSSMIQGGDRSWCGTGPAALVEAPTRTRSVPPSPVAAACRRYVAPCGPPPRQGCEAAVVRRRASRVVVQPSRRFAIFWVYVAGCSRRRRSSASSSSGRLWAVPFWWQQASISSTGWGWSAILLTGPRNTQMGRRHTGQRPFGRAWVRCPMACPIRRVTRQTREAAARTRPRATTPPCRFVRAHPRPAVATGPQFRDMAGVALTRWG